MPPGSAKDFKPSCYVDTIAVDIIALDDNVANVDADAKDDPPNFWLRGIAFAHSRLNCYRTFQSVYHAGELDQRPVTHKLDGTATVFSDFWIDQSLRSALSSASVPASSAAISRL